MARTPYATRTYDTPQKGPRVPNVKPSYIIIHHAASTSFDGVIALEMGAREVSSTCIIKDDQIASMFDEQYRAWSLSSQYWDSVSLSVETCNEVGAPTWLISEASYASLAKVVADWCKRYGIPCDREHIMGHREVYERYKASYQTFCPGDGRGNGISVDRVVRDAAAILAGPVPAPVIPMKRRSKMFGFMRGPDGSIYLIDGEHKTYRNLTGGEWNAYAAAGAKYANASAAEVKSTLAQLKQA